jgi:Mg/Co/Ni transporter MgtE
MKPAVVFLLAFVVAGAASTGAKVMLTKAPPRPAADSARADSARTDSGKRVADSTRAGPDTAIAASAPIVTAPSDTARVVAVDSAKQKPAVAAAAAVAAPATNQSDTTAEASERRIAKVFTSMDAKQAAKVLEHMSDGDVQIILGYVGVKQAAQIMSALPPERVATLSKLSMAGGKR